MTHPLRRGNPFAPMWSNVNNTLHHGLDKGESLCIKRTRLQETSGSFSSILSGEKLTKVSMPSRNRSFSAADRFSAAGWSSSLEASPPFPGSPFPALERNRLGKSLASTGWSFCLGPWIGCGFRGRSLSPPESLWSGCGMCGRPLTRPLAERDVPPKPGLAGWRRKNQWRLGAFPIA